MAFAVAPHRNKSPGGALVPAGVASARLHGDAASGEGFGAECVKAPVVGGLHQPFDPGKLGRRRTVYEGRTGRSCARPPRAARGRAGCWRRPPAPHPEWPRRPAACGAPASASRTEANGPSASQPQASTSARKMHGDHRLVLADHDAGTIAVVLHFLIDPPGPTGARAARAVNNAVHRRRFRRGSRFAAVARHGFCLSRAAVLDSACKRGLFLS